MAKADNEPGTPSETEAQTPPVEPVAEVAVEAVEVEPDPNFVSYTVTKAGDGHIHTGKHHRETGAPETFKRGDQVHNVPRDIAEGLEDRHFAEIDE